MVKKIDPAVYEDAYYDWRGGPTFDDLRTPERMALLARLGSTWEQFLAGMRKFAHEYESEESQTDPLGEAVGAALDFEVQGIDPFSMSEIARRRAAAFEADKQRAAEEAKARHAAREAEWQREQEERLARQAEEGRAYTAKMAPIRAARAAREAEHRQQVREAAADIIVQTGPGRFEIKGTGKWFTTKQRALAWLAKNTPRR